MDIEPIYAFWVGFILPNVVSIVNRPTWKSWQKGVAVFVVSLVAGTVTALADGNLTGKTWAETVGVVLVSAIGSYKLIWQPSGIGPKLELATNGNSVTKNQEPGK